jgi:putative MATE family efflux protein
MNAAGMAEQHDPADHPPAVPPRHGSEHLLTINPWRAVIQLAMPTTLVMLVAATSNVLYTYYVSRLGNDAIAAVSLVFPISLIAITAMGGGIGAGASSAVARALGGGRREAATAVAEHAFVLSVSIGIVFAATILVGAPRLFTLMGGRGVILAQATLFARVLFGGAAISFTAAMFDSIMRGEGNVRVPAIWSSASLLLQMLLTPLFMFVFGWGLVGAAVASLSSQLLAMLPRARHVFGGGGLVHPRPLPRVWVWSAFGEILRVGIPASLSTTINYSGLMILTGVVARLGEAHLAAYGLGTRLDFLLLSFAFGFGAAVLTLVGMATGARQPERARTYVLRAGAIIVALLGALGLLLFWQPHLWIGLFTQDAAIHEVGAQYFRIIGPSYPFVGVAMVLSFAFQGLGRATIPLAWMSVRVVGVVSISLLCTQWLGLGDRAVFTTVAAGNIVSAVIMSLLFWRTERVLTASSKHRHSGERARGKEPS